MTASTYLTFDEQRAAEAAFQGDPCDPEWSPTAIEVYHGILGVMLRRCSPTGVGDSLLFAAAREEHPSVPAMIA